MTAKEYREAVDRITEEVANIKDFDVQSVWESVVMLWSDNENRIMEELDVEGDAETEW